MSVMIRIGAHKAILRHGHWVSADPGLERRLNEETGGWIRDTGGPPLASRDQEKLVAEEMVKRFNGRVVLHMRSQSRQSSDYFLKQRQMHLDFTDSIRLTRKASA